MTDRVPPQNVEAEMGVLGAVLLESDQYPEVEMVLRGPEDFYRDEHQVIYRHVRALAAAGEPIDLITVAERLRRAGGRARIDWDDVLARLVASVPHAANAAYHARIVREKAQAREIIEGCVATLRDAYADLLTSEELVAAFERRALAAADATSAGRTAPIGDDLHDQMAAIRLMQQGVSTGLASGVAGLDRLLGGLRPAQLIILAARPSMGKSALAMNISESVAADRGEGVLFVSLEMGREEIQQRFLVQRSRVFGSKARVAGGLTDIDFAALSRAYDAFLAAPLFLDDTPGRTVSQVAANARRHRARHGIALLVVDYIQLVAAEGRSESRQQDVSEISRRLKLLARELGIPVLALSQLNRQAEKRSDNRPMMSDLRECITMDATLIDAMTGEPCTVGDLMRTGRPMPVYGMGDPGGDSPWKSVPALAQPFWSTGVKPVFRLRTATGRTLRCTANHPLRTLEGWTPLGRIRIGRRIAVPRFLPEPPHARDNRELPVDRARLLGYLISDGTYLKLRSVGYVKADMALVDDVCRIAREQFGIEARDHRCPGPSRQVELTGPRLGPGCNPVINWLQGLGIHGQKGPEKRVPPAIFRSPNATVAAFLGALWAGDGCVVLRPRGSWVLKFTSTSMGLLSDVQSLLLRFGIVSVLGKPGRNSKSTVDIASLVVGDSREVCRFAECIPIPGCKGERLAVAARDCSALEENAKVDRLPLELGEEVAAAKRAAGHSWTTLGYRCQGKEMHREALAVVASRLDSHAFRALAESDVLWDRVESIEPDGEEEVFDTRVPSLHNFVANNIFVHNSGAIEQDADAVLLLYRPDYYDRADRPGEAELIVAKNRNGETGTVRLAFRKGFMRFEDLPAGVAPDDGDF